MIDNHDLAGHQALVNSARASVDYHERGQIWVDACAEEIKLKELPLAQGKLRDAQDALAALLALPAILIDGSSVVEAARSLQAERKRADDIAVAERHVAACQEGIAIAESRYLGARQAADQLRPNIAEARANLAAFEAHLADFQEETK